MTDDIPKIAFRSPKKEKFEFEVLPLRQLFSRNDSLSWPLDRPHRVQFYQILYITKGKGKHYIDFKPWEYTRGSLVFVSAGQVHAFEINNDTEGFLLLFTEDFITRNMVHSDILSFSRLYNYHLYPPVIPQTAVSFFSLLVNEIYKEYIIDETFAKEEMLRTQLKLLLLKAEQIRQSLVPKEKNSEWMIKFSRFRKLLENHFTENRDAKAYARRMNISYNHLNKISKTITGQTAKKFIDRFVVLEIKRQLAVSDISVKELTYDMGFDEPTNFVKYFKKHTGNSPAQFKKEMQKTKG